jgi:Mn2+/Fe2+ NRAMP family transporter
MLRTLGLGMITGAADDDPSAIGTYASAGAALGPSFLWTAPVTFPMMCAVVYLSAKLGQVSGKGLFHVIKDHYSRWILYPALIGVLIGNTIEAGADIGGMSAAIGVLVPAPMPLIIIPVTLAIFALQVWGSYTLIRNVFRWLALTLLAYVGAAILAKPDLYEVIKGTFVPVVAGGGDWDHVVGLPVYVAIESGSRGGDCDGAPPFGRPERRDEQGAAGYANRRDCGDVLLERRDVLHRSFHRFHAL